MSCDAGRPIKTFPKASLRFVEIVLKNRWLSILWGPDFYRSGWALIWSSISVMISRYRQVIIWWGIHLCRLMVIAYIMTNCMIKGENENAQKLVSTLCGLQH